MHVMFMNYIIVYILHVYNILSYSVYTSDHVFLFVHFATIFNAQCTVVDRLKLINAQVTLYCNEQVLQFHSLWKEC